MMVSGLGVTNLQAQTRTAPTADQAQVTLNLQDVDIRVLINTVAEVSGKNFVVDPRVKGKVSVISGASLDPDQLYDVFLSILEVHQFATVDSGSVIKVLPANVIKQRPTPTLFSPTQDTTDAQITQIIQLTHASVQELVPIIRPLIPPTSHFAPHMPSNSVVLTDTAANIQRVLKIIKRIDVPDERSNTRIIMLEVARASDLAGTLTQLISSSGEQKGPAGSPRVSVQALDSINALVINATDTEYAKIQALVDELDIERELQSDINVIYLKHAKAEDLVSILNDVTASKTEGTARESTVQADEATNSLIVKASGSQLKTMRSVIDQLDQRRAQVFVETVIAEVSLDQEANLGIEWNVGGPNQINGGGDGTTATTVGNLIERDNPNTIIGTAEGGFSDSGFNYSLLDFKKYKLDVIVNALRADSNSNILSTPTLLTLDNETAEIVVGQEVPFITGRFNNGFNNSTTTDAQGNVTSTAGNSFQTIERKDVGIKLKIKPQISEGNTIQMEVLQEISSVSNTTVQGQADLITNRRSIEAVVQVDDGQVIALGGLIQDDVIDTVSRVPILGKIPILGALFRNNQKTAIKRNLMVFLKPRIIRSADELAKYSKTKYDEVRRDGQISRLNSSQLLINDAEPPVLDEYESVVEDGLLGSERRREMAEEAAEGRVPRTGLRRMIHKQFNKKPKQEEPAKPGFTPRSDGDDYPLPTDNDSAAGMDEVLKPNNADPDIIEWGDNPPPPPAKAAAGAPPDS
ncbi:MAG: hypothetical protein HKN50_09835 [Gammaproteobacteria bacterium]|nr:hypothetical protein [Gammaproteobacteria bacterium]